MSVEPIWIQPGGDYIESESTLAHEGEAWVLGRVDSDAQICDLVVIAEDAHVGGPHYCVQR